VVLDQEAQSVHPKVVARCRIRGRPLPGEVGVTPALLHECKLGLGRVEVRVCDELLNQKPQESLLGVRHLASWQTLERTEARLAARPRDNIAGRARADDGLALLIAGERRE